MTKQQNDEIKLNVKKTFPVLKKNVELHQTPPNRWLIVLNGKRYNLSEDAWKSFLLCTGKNSVYDIMKTIGKNGEADDVVQQKNASDFFINAKKIGEVELQNRKNKKPRNIKITGGFDAFYPYFLSIELTSQCNLHCIHCYANASAKPSPYIPTTSLISVLNHLRQQGLHVVELTGGEPLLHPNFSTILRFCASKFDSVHVFTNGTLLTPEFLSLFHKYNKNTKLYISLDGSTPQIHDSIRGVPGAFHKTLNAISSLSKKGIQIKVSMTVIPQNVLDIENTLLLAKQSGATQFLFTLVLPFGRTGHSHLSFSKAENNILNKTTDKIKKKYPNFVNFSQYYDLQKVQAKNCGAGFYKYTISPTGDIRPCIIGNTQWFSIGNIFKKTPEQVFSSSKTSFFADLKTPNHNSKPCCNCQHRFYCSGCWVRAVDINLKKNMRCQWLKQSGLEQVLNV